MQWRDRVVNNQWFRGQRSQRSVPVSTRSRVEEIDFLEVGYVDPIGRGCIYPARCNTTIPAVISYEMSYHNVCGDLTRVKGEGEGERRF